MKILLLLPLLLGFSVPAIAHNEANGGNSIISHMQELLTNGSTAEEGEEGKELEAEIDGKQGLKGEGI